jgi:chromosomal replication initiator protein
MKIKMKDLLIVVAEYYNVPPHEILGKSRKPKYAKPRQIFCWLCRVKLDKTFPEIGRFLSRDHTTIIHAARKCREERWMSMELADELMVKAGGDSIYV